MGLLRGIVVIGTVLIIWCAVDFSLGRHFYEKRWKKREYPLRKGQLQLITNGADLFKSFFTDLRNASSSIHVLFYIVKNDRFSKAFFELLMEQADKGVKIRLLLDWLGSRSASKTLIKEARRKGIEIVFCHKPRFPFFFYTLQQRNHRKITIIDGKVGYVGGYNVGKEYIDLDPKLSPWRDYHLRIEGEGVADLQQEFLTDWRRAAGKLDDTSLFPPLPAGEMLHRFYPTEGVNGDQHILQLFKKAKKEIIVGTPYFIPPKNSMAVLEQALMRGVSVTILVPETSDHPVVKEASFPYLRRILALGGTVCQYQKGFFHAKVIVIDESICDIGTANFDQRSVFLNHELNCFIYDQSFIAEVLAAIREDLDFSTQLKLNELQNLRFSVRVKEWIGKRIEVFL